MSNSTPPCYDASGNLTNDGVNQYLYDGDGRLCAVNRGGTMTGYIYDADGARVAKGAISQWSCDPSANGFTATADYVLGPGGEQVTEMSAGAWQHSNVYAGGKLLATYDVHGLHFYTDDPLGTRRVQTDYAADVEQSCASLFYGDGLNCTGSTITPTEHHFTGKIHDDENGLDDFGARYYASNMGRWISPDWSANPEAVPYSTYTNPQSLNLYNYMRNNPLSGADPDGHCDWCQKLWNGISGNGFQTNAQLTEQRADQAAPNATVDANDSGVYTPHVELGSGMQEAIDAEKSNGPVDVGASVVGLASATVSGVPALAVGLASGTVSSVNDPSQLNLTINAAGGTLGVISTAAEGTAVGTAAGVGALGVAAGAAVWSLSNFTSNIITSVFAPPPEANNVNGVTVQQPDMSDPNAYHP